MRKGQRIIIHMDMDAFFAAIETLDNPKLRGKPVVVGADPKGGKGRGVVSTCSYEARRYGIRSAQPISEAYRRCPDAAFLPVRMQRYTEVSKAIRRILHDFTPSIEPLSIDEAFLDVTGSAHLFGGKYEVPERIKERVFKDTGLTASFGVAPNKMLAKIASDLDKPNGLVFVEENEVESFLNPLPVSKLWGVGSKTEKALQSMGITTIGDIARKSFEELENRFGKHGRHLSRLARGIDDRPVEKAEVAKSIGHEKTFQEDTGDLDIIRKTLAILSDQVAYRLRSSGFKGKTVCTKVRFEDFETCTRSKTLQHPLDTSHEIYEAAAENLAKVEFRGRKVRLIGVSLSTLERISAFQTCLFDFDGDLRSSQEKWQRLGRRIDEIKSKYGEEVLKRGSTLE